MPLSVNHLGQLPSVTISFNLAPGVALSDAVNTIAGVQQKLNVPATVQGSFQGTAQAFQSSTANMGLLLMIAIVTVYIILGILYESFIHPLTILSESLPSAAVGALITLYIFKHAAKPLCLRRHDHADRHSEEECDHDDRLCAHTGTRRRHFAGKGHS